MPDPIHPRLLRAMLAQEINALLHRLQEIDALAPGESAELEVNQGGYRLAISVSRPALAVAAETDSRAGVLPPGAPRLHRQLLAKATEAPKTARELIRLAGYKYNTTSRAGISWLVHNGYLVMAGNNSYRLPPAATGNRPA